MHECMYNSAHEHAYMYVDVHACMCVGLRLANDCSNVKTEIVDFL